MVTDLSPCKARASSEGLSPSNSNLAGFARCHTSVTLFGTNGHKLDPRTRSSSGGNILSSDRSSSDSKLDGVRRRSACLASTNGTSASSSKMPSNIRIRRLGNCSPVRSIGPCDSCTLRFTKGTASRRGATIITSEVGNGFARHFDSGR